MVWKIQLWESWKWTSKGRSYRNEDKLKAVVEAELNVSQIIVFRYLGCNLSKVKKNWKSRIKSCTFGNILIARFWIELWCFGQWLDINESLKWALKLWRLCKGNNSLFFFLKEEISYWLRNKPYSSIHLFFCTTTVNWIEIWNLICENNCF